MTEQDAYMHGNSYEFFIRRAFKCERGKHGADTAYFKFLLLADMGDNFLAQPYDKQFAGAKKYLIKAIDKFLSRKPTEDEKETLLQIKDSIDQARNATELVPLITSGLNNTKRFMPALS